MTKTFQLHLVFVVKVLALSDISLEQSKLWGKYQNKESFYSVLKAKIAKYVFSYLGWYCNVNTYLRAFSV